MEQFGLPINEVSECVSRIELGAGHYRHRYFGARAFDICMELAEAFDFDETIILSLELKPF